ncbi:hypothetical protein [Streptomyces sp. NBC_00328]|uniref:hypothetical protein n=1 Tax=Streptomyces sp. NBC_00328 TaxID=2903646 RepID=UPI002E2D0257|nr:hypothetical protein [Streptomyces sp. NBC_00328]
MTQHTTEDVYEKLTSLEKSVDIIPREGGSKAVTSAELDRKIASLKKAIEEGPKDKPTDLIGAISELPVLKEVIGIFKANGPAAILILSIVGLKAGLATIGVKFLDLQKAFQAFIRSRARGREVTTNDRGRITLATPEQPQSPNPLPSVDNVNAVKDAIHDLNQVVRTYSTRARNLPSPRSMRQLASAAGQLTRAAEQHARVDQLAQAAHTLEQRFTALSRVVAGGGGSAN